MTRRKLMGAAIFGAAGLGIAGLAAAAGYFVVPRDDDDDDEGREGNERNEKEQGPAPNSTPAPQSQNGASR